MFTHLTSKLSSTYEAISNSLSKAFQPLAKPISDGVDAIKGYWEGMVEAGKAAEALKTQEEKLQCVLQRLPEKELVRSITAKTCEQITKDLGGDVKACQRDIEIEVNTAAINEALPLCEREITINKQMYLEAMEMHSNHECIERQSRITAANFPRTFGSSTRDRVLNLLRLHHAQLNVLLIAHLRREALGNLVVAEA